MRAKRFITWSERHSCCFRSLFAYVGVTDKKSSIWFDRGNIHEPPSII